MLTKKQRKASKKAREMYQNLSEEEKDKRCQYAREQYKIILYYFNYFI